MKSIYFAKYSDEKAICHAVAEDIYTKIYNRTKANKKTVLGLATGQTYIGVYKELMSLFKNGITFDLSKLYTFNLDEYYPINPEHERSYHREMKEWLFEPLQSINSSFDYKKQTHLLDGTAKNPEKECKRYEKLIRDYGGIDIQLLGIGTNGHIAFNEPNSKGNSRTRIVELADETIRVNSRFFKSKDEVPKTALSMGIETIMEAKELIVTVFGLPKQPIINKIFSCSEPTEEIPASFLLKHNNVNWYTDIAVRM